MNAELVINFGLKFISPIFTILKFNFFIFNFVFFFYARIGVNLNWLGCVLNSH